MVPAHRTTVVMSCRDRLWANQVGLNEGVSNALEHARPTAVLRFDVEDVLGAVPIVVLGMHRSGTSSLAGTLVLLGGKAPLSLMAPLPENPKGFWESNALTAFNDEILALAGSAWDNWRNFSVDWHEAVQASDLGSRAEALLIREFGAAARPVIKDPRMCRLAPFWSPVFAQLAWSPRFVLPIRSPLEVAQSLQRRDRLTRRQNPLSLDDAYLLWLRHNLEAEARTRDNPRAFIDWNRFVRGWCAALQRASNQMDLDLLGAANSCVAQVDEFISADLRHHDAAVGEPLSTPDFLRAAYDALLTLVENPASARARRTLDDIREEFAAPDCSFEQLEKYGARGRVEARESETSRRSCGAAGQNRTFFAASASQSKRYKSGDRSHGKGPLLALIRFARSACRYFANGAQSRA